MGIFNGLSCELTGPYPHSNPPGSVNTLTYIRKTYTDTEWICTYTEDTHTHVVYTTTPGK
jgi:hypothetical protein